MEIFAEIFANKETLSHTEAGPCIHGNLTHDRRQTDGKGHNLIFSIKTTGYTSGKMRKLDSIPHISSENKL